MAATLEAGVIAKIERKHVVQLRVWVEGQDIAQKPSVQTVDPGVKLRTTVQMPGALHNGGPGEVVNLLEHVQFDHATSLGDWIRYRHELLVMEPVDVLDAPQPLVQESKPSVGQRGLYARAAVVPTYDDLAHLEILHGKLEHAKQIEVRVHHQVCDISMDKELARTCPGDRLGGHSTVRAADPEALWTLLFGDVLEVPRVDLQLFGDPNLVGGKQLFVRLHRNVLGAERAEREGLCRSHERGSRAFEAQDRREPRNV